MVFPWITILYTAKTVSPWLNVSLDEVLCSLVITGLIFDTGVQHAHLGAFYLHRYCLKHQVTWKIISFAHYKALAYHSGIRSWLFLSQCLLIEFVKV